jgi:hypothetical protein
MEMKKNLPLVVALGIPVVLTAVIALAVYLPGFGPEPGYDFVYAVRNYYGPGPIYDVVEGKVIERPALDYPEGEMRYPGPAAQLYYYDVESKISKNLTLQESQAHSLETSRTSPDGYVVENGGGSGIFPFYESGNYYDQYLVGNNRRLKTTISDYNFEFLGWVRK